MDAGQSSIQRSIPSSKNLVSPNKQTLTVREYEQTIEKLSKENFDLKLNLYLNEESKKSQEDKDNITPNHVQVIVQLKSETESLQNELHSKDELLKDALERADRFESDFKELEKKYADLQSELSSLSGLPSKESYSSLLDEKENLIKYTETLEKELTEKDEKINDGNQKIEFLDNKIRTLEEKIKKMSLAIQGFVYKNYKEKEMLPDELRSIVISATQAAKTKNKDTLAVAVKSITSCLNHMMSSSVLSEVNRNIRSPPVKCLREETLEKSGSSLPSHSNSVTELSSIQNLKEVLTEKNTPKMNLDAVIHDSFVRGKSLSESHVNMSERAVINCIDFSAVSPSTEENLISFSNDFSNQACSATDHSPIDIKTVSLDYIDKRKSNSEESDQLIKVLDENKHLKSYLEEKLALIKDLHENFLELELKLADLQKTENNVSNENKILKKDLKEQLAITKDLHESCLELELKVADLEKTERGASNEIEKLKKDLEEKVALIDNLRDRCRELELKVPHLQKAERDASNENEKFKKNLEEKGAIINNLHDKCKELELKVSSLQEAESDVSDKNEKLKRNLQEKHSQVQDLQTANRELELKKVTSPEIENGVFTENKKLKHDLSKQSALIQALRDRCERLDVKGVHLQDTGCDALRAPILCTVYTQTAIAGYNLLNEHKLTKLHKDAELSNNVEELREDILLLLLAFEDKDKELSAVKQSLSVVQEDLKRALNTSAVIDKDFYENERNELHERLAISRSLNEDLMKQLKILKKFMEDLLQHKFDSSVESIDENSVAKCLDKSLQLSSVLSEHLSICEGSKLFEECGSFYNRDSYPYEKSDFLQGLSRFSLPEQHSSHSQGVRTLEEYISFAQNERIKESDASQLYLHCWQQMNSTSQNQPQTSHLVQNNIISRHLGYASSDSDIWSEPDRNVSLQRIGISLQNSPVSSKSPRKLRQKEKRFSSRLSSERDTSSSELRCTSKKRHGYVHRRLSFKENIKNQDFISEKFYFLVTEKYSKLKGLLDELENIENGKLSEPVWIRLNKVVASLGEALGKLHIARENARDFPSAACGRCVMLELFTDIKASHKEADFFIDGSSSEQNILEQFSREIRLLKEACKETFPLFCESTDKKSQSAECYIISEDEQVRIDEFENVIANLNHKNEELCQKLETVNILYSKEKEMFESAKAENLNLSDEINNLRQELSKLKQIESDLSLKNEKLLEELSHVNENNSELNKVLRDLEQKSKESGLEFDNLTAELQKTKTDLVSMNEKCLEFEKQLNEQIQMKKECEDKLKTLETSSLNEKKNYLSMIDELNAEKNSFVQELQRAQEKKMAVEKEYTLINNNLQSKISEIMSLQDIVKKLETEKETLVSHSKDIQIKLISAEEDLKNVQKKCENYEEKMLTMSKEYEAKYSEQLKEIEAKSLAEKEKLINEISLLTNENTSISDSLTSKSNELLSLQIKLKSAKEDLNNLQKICEENEVKMLTISKEYEAKYSEQCKELEARYSLHCKELEAKSLAEKEKLINEISLLTNEKAGISDSLKSKENDILSLQKIIKEHQWTIETLNARCEELQNQSKTLEDYLEDLESKCHAYEGTIKIVKEKEAGYCQRLKQIEETSLTEKEKLVEEISLLKKEREQILEKLKNEQIRYEKLKTEQIELSENYVKSCAQLTSLKLLNEELKNKQQHLLQRNEFYGNALQSSNNECNILSQDLKCMRDTLQNLESKCLAYEKQLTASAGLKDRLVECLLSINNEFLVHRQKLNEMYKTYGYENYVLWDELPSNEYMPAIDEDSIQTLCENISSEAKKLFQSIDMLFGFLKSVHGKSSETKSPKDRSFTRKQMETHKSENDDLKMQTAHLQHVIDELQNCITQKEKSIQFSAVEIQSLKEKLYHSEQEIERENQLLKKKDDEITMLQERIFNMQTHINSITLRLSASFEKSPCATKQPALDSDSPDNQLPSKPLSKTSKMCQTSDIALQSADETSTSVSSLESSKNGCCEKYIKKCRSLHTKLTLCQKHIEILEKDKNDLRESFLQQLQNKDDETKRDSPSSKSAELESKLEQKKAFICELKSELLKTCNSLIDKEKEIDDLKQKLSESEAKVKHSMTNVSDRHSIGVPKSIESSIKTLKQYKWKLIQAIFDIQRQFYQKRGIHLSYFDKFKNRATDLYSMQLTQSLPKSESLPFLETSLLKEQRKPQDEKEKYLLGLELDIECLENLKIFLNRFFVPAAIQAPKTDFEEKKVPSEKSYMPNDVEEKEVSLDMNEVSHISFPDDSVTAAFEDPSALKVFSFDVFASVVSHNLDCIQKFFSSVEKYECLNNLDLSAEESTDKAEVKLLLLKIFQETKSLQEEINTLFNLNELLKTYDFVSALKMPSSITNLDVSDRESVMSEETIAVSRTESPLSFENITPLKIPHPETLQLEQSPLKSESAGSKVAVIEPFGAKVTAISSSCDSICPRSHYSSPDLGIESDPNHDSSAPEHKEEDIKKYQRIIQEEQKFLVNLQQKTPFTNTESAGRWSGHKFGEILYAIGNLQHFELLRQEVKESLVAIKSVLSRTGDGLHHIAKYSSPRKTLEFNTLKSIKDTCVHLEVCLKKSNDLVNKFWTAPCPSEKEWKLLNDENQSLSEQLSNLKVMLQKRENEFKKAIGKLEHAQVIKANMEKKISKKLVKTKKVIRQAELKLLETRCQNFPPVPKYPSDHTEQIDTMHQT